MIAALIVVLGGCAELPPEARVSHDSADETVTALSAGTNQVGEPCRYQPQKLAATADIRGGFDVYCGSWQQPSARIFEAATPIPAAELGRAAHTSVWRAGLDERFACADPETTTLLNDAAAQLMHCTRRRGGWPQLAAVVNVGGKTWFLDSVPSALPAVQAALGAISGQSSAAQSAGASSAQLLAEIAAHPFGSGDLAAYYTLVRLGAQANDMGDYGTAEQALRNALALQQRILGADDPALALPIMDLALQISNQGRYHEAEILFGRAAELVGKQSDRLVDARLTLYLAEHDLNRSNFDAAAAKAAQAAADFADEVPPSLIDVAQGSSRDTSRGVADSVMLGPEEQRAVSGLAASWSLQALVAYKKGDFQLPSEKDRQVRALLKASGVSPPGIIPRARRVVALSEAGRGDTNDALPEFGTVVDLFDRYQPNGRAVVVTLFLAGKTARMGGDNVRALELFRRGAQLARTRHERYDVLPEHLVTEYLSALDEANKAEGADHQALAAEMLEASQLIEGNVTGRFAAQALARLSQTDPKVRDLLRSIQDADQRLSDLATERDRLTGGGQDQATKDAVAKIDAQIDETRQNRLAADSAAQAASPDYAKLVSTVSSAAAIQHVLGPREGLLTLVIGSNASFGVLVSGDQVEEYRIDTTRADTQLLVGAIRKSIEPRFRDGKAELPVFDVEAAYGLYETLFGPIDKHLEGISRLVVALNGPISAMPLEILVTKKTPPVKDGDYRDVPFLLKRMAISYVPAPQTLVVLRQNAKPSAGTQPYIGFGDFVPATAEQIGVTFPPDRCAADYEALSNLPPLPDTRAEILNVGEKIFHAPREDLVLGADFTKARLLETNLTQYRVVHLATHAFLPTELHCRSEPMIALSASPGARNADDAFIGLSEVVSLRLDAELVVLSACNTAGPAEGETGDSLSGLTKAFFFAGARGVLVTHWSLESVSGQRLMTLTLSPKGRGHDSAEDLRQAKLEMLKEASGEPGGRGVFYSHPFFWAPFVLVGDGIRGSAEGKGSAPAT